MVRDGGVILQHSPFHPEVDILLSIQSMTYGVAAEREMRVM